MPTLTHPKLPGRPVKVSERTAKQYLKAGWITDRPSTPPAPTKDPKEGGK